MLRFPPIEDATVGVDARRAGQRYCPLQSDRLERVLINGNGSQRLVQSVKFAHATEYHVVVMRKPDDMASQKFSPVLSARLEK